MVDVIPASFGGNPCNYGKRAVAYIIDLFLTVIPPAISGTVGLILLFVFAPLGILLLVLAGIYLIVFPIVNLIRQGTKGSTYGKSQQKIALVKNETGEPIGILFAFLRILIFWFFNSISAGIFFIVDYLFPAFDKKRQRVIDKLLSTVVVESVNVTHKSNPSDPLQTPGMFHEDRAHLPPPSI